ncbi:MAG TPA: ABC transporter substrate-binding protein [Acidimicrobiales bacterium]|nr:ABC transporter substrate-binding protein [Acidimicrobiales bacterium]
MSENGRRIAVAAVAGGLTLAACSGGSALSGGGGGKGGTATSGRLPSCPVGALAQATTPVQITMWESMSQANGEALTALTDRFNSSQTQVHVNLVNQTSYDDTFAKFTAGLANGQLPDLAQMEDIHLQPVIDSRAALPVQSCINASNYPESDFVPRTVKYWTVGGVQWAMPFSVSNPVLIYNRAAFTKAGLDPDRPPATLAELATDAAALKRAGYAMGLKLDPWHLEQWSALAGQLYANHGNGRDGRVTAVSFDNAAGQQIFSTLASMVRSGQAVTNPASGPSQFDNLLGIGQGKYAMTIDTSAVLGTVYQLLPQYKGVQLGVAPMPGRSDDGGVLVGGSALYILTKDPAHQAATWKFMTFLDQPDSQAYWAAHTGYVPVRQSAASDPVMTAAWAREPGLKVAYEQLLAGGTGAAASGPVIGAYNDVRAAVLNAEESMYLSGVAPATALQNAAKAANAAISAYNLRIGG